MNRFHTLFEKLSPISSARQLQENLISAVATNVGSYLDDHIVRATIFTRLNSLARSTSAISWTNFDKLVQMYNAGILPCIPSKGSLRCLVPKCDGMD
ncbi:Tyrosine 2,3-aminomutase [Candidatus Rhabdochlamydia oedothoracis]|uniref:Tyrosine 2,3-aminomutase n=1 Tax=Candidatus Rhabdochlamydia oedothoracis TaxID=2720720 RepID=A0ABX8V6E5_9BACT|nr:aromatic amino acid lyase [Candidatus Rhabdochlamydia sp. W815]KAG6559799.1 Tyrosine 2,3-aminomutase [Candidatus Rhabdochlamydia sp. W815]QYF49040.1 Tyrosine 2,3-aminomutase [Candidatus Rhabdochlamydia oedothoracis]